MLHSTSFRSIERVSPTAPFPVHESIDKKGAFKIMEMKCPFCDEDDFDEIGLKYHLLHHCDVYDSIDISSIKGLFSIGVGDYDGGTGGIKRPENSMACSCFGHKAGKSTAGWICPVHGQCF